jgi:hypothetical protein
MAEKVLICFGLVDVGNGERKTVTHFAILDQPSDHDFLKNCLPYNCFAYIL